MHSILIQNATVLTMDPKLGDIKGCDILIEGSRIVDIRPGIHAPASQLVDATEMIVTPGYVDSHRHTWQCLMRNVATDWSLGQYHAGVRLVMGDRYTPDDMFLANYLGALECLDAGVTTLLDFSHNNNSPDHSEAAVRGLKDAGIRGLFGYGNSSAESIPVSNLPTNFDDVRRIQIRHFSTKNASLGMAFAARGPQYSTLAQTERDFRAAHELGLPITVHVGSGHWGLNRPVDALRSRGLLYPRTVYVHCCTIADDEIQMIADSGGFVAVSPEVELNMGQGWPAALRARSAGIEPSLSIDVTTSIGGDMFSAMRAVLAGVRAPANAHALAENRILAEPALRSRDALRFATMGGATACGLDTQVGSITIGKQADLVLIDTNHLGMMPMNSPVSSVVESAGVGHVDSVILAGRFVKRSGELLGIDKKALRRRVESTRDALFARAGVAIDGTWLPVPHIGGTSAVRR